MAKKVDAIRTDPSLSEQERVWKVIGMIAKQLDDDDDDEILELLLGGSDD